MNKPRHTVDELRITRFLAPRQGKAERAEIMTYLINHPEAVEVLRMAIEALEAARTPEIPTPHFKTRGL